MLHESFERKPADSAGSEDFKERDYSLDTDNTSFSHSSELRQEELSKPLSQYIERELKFLLKEDTTAGIDLNSLPAKKLTQHYFPAELTEAMGEVALTLAGISGTLPENFSFSRARIRRVKGPDGSSTFYLQAKGRLPEYDQSEKVEISVEISLELYDKLKQVATAGTIKKTRYYMDGLVFLDDGTEVPVTAEIDYVRSAGSAGGKAIKKSDRFLTVDLEVPDQETLNQIRKGCSSFDFLKRKAAVNLTDQPEEIKKPLSMTGLAESGFTPAVKELLRDLKAIKK